MTQMCCVIKHSININNEFLAGILLMESDLLTGIHVEFLFPNVPPNSYVSARIELCLTEEPFTKVSHPHVSMVCGSYIVIYFVSKHMITY